MFQSTPSGGKATNPTNIRPILRLVSIHAFRGEGDLEVCLFIRRITVSIHAFRGEGDLINTYRNNTVLGFQSTPSGGKATALRAYRRHVSDVSIHAFRGEGDRAHVYVRARHIRFNPRLPGGRRPAYQSISPRSDKFQSTPSGGKATAISRAAVPCSRQIL